MRFKFLFILLIAGCTTISYSQDIQFPISEIPLKLILNANTVLRAEEVVVDIDDLDKMTIHSKKVITVLNSSGDDQVSTGEYYDENSRIKKQKVVVYNAKGEKIKEFKQRDFKDVSGVSSNDLYSDNRISYLDYTPLEYPYTIEYNSEILTNSTVFIRSWTPIDNYYQSVQFSSYKINNPKNIALRVKEENLGDTITSSTSNYNVHYEVRNLAAYEAEDLSPSLKSITPKVKVALNQFSLVGVTGEAENWSDFGKWQYENLLKHRNQLSGKTISDINMLTKGVIDTLEKARIIYQYVQNKTRYISIQLGIGGWMPMLAMEVDDLGYGDCKALTNYTKSILESQGITSYYTVVYAGEEKRDIDADFASMQGNHVILNIPQENEDVWLECTSQTHPFNYLGDFTDNRNVLLVKPTGGEIVKTKKYNTEENITKTLATITLEKDGLFTAEGSRNTFGVEYGNYYGLQQITEKRQKTYYKNLLGHLKYLEIKAINFKNHKKERSFEENLKLSGSHFGTNAGSRILVPLSIFKVETENAPRYSTRQYPLEISRGKTVIDEFTIELPENYGIETLPQSKEIENQFGSYSFKVEPQDLNKIKVSRKYVLRDGVWKKEEYEAFREFMNQVNVYNNQKAVITVINK
ncbi:DUF3857 domain-containing protein [Gillisia sp. M10.2A]|uniref:DUF3857 domain-containing protein n=1 Tax=Gillisia lutea TaxID=2909668 RepID=A0ABS9EI28_9FLAO|nr:DUF3857 domain-containing protein [Gillisia lutea]MCF4102007.1 DUF3857 domain-containing protein [Gillisia lutea]